MYIYSYVLSLELCVSLIDVYYYIILVAGVHIQCTRPQSTQLIHMHVHIYIMPVQALGCDLCTCTCTVHID